MGLRRGIGKAARSFGRTFVNVPGWLGLGSMKSPTKAIIQQSKTLYTPPPKGNQQETFEQAVERLQLTEKDLQERVNTLQWEAILSLAMTIMLFAYSLYLIWRLHVVVAFIALGVVLLFGLKYLKARFRIAQIKQRRLDLSFKQWLTPGVKH